jgi:hypothetical protein
VPTSGRFMSTDPSPSLFKVCVKSATVGTRHDDRHGGWGGYIYKDMKKKRTERHGLEPRVCVLTRCSRDAVDPEADTCIIGSSREEGKNMYLRDVFFSPPIRPLLRRLFRFLLDKSRPSARDLRSFRGIEGGGGAQPGNSKMEKS